MKNRISFIALILLVSGAAYYSLGSAHLVHSKLTKSEKQMLNERFFIDECSQGIEAFGGTTHQLITQSCTECHSSEGPGPGFATNEMMRSYFQVKNYVDFSDIPNSYFVERAGNGHCDCDMTEEEMAASLQEWWDSGENQCATERRYYTETITIPEDLPQRGEGFTKLSWDLRNISRDFRNTRFELEIQKFADPTPETPGAYRVRSPRISRGRRTIHLRDIRVLINQKMDALANAYTRIDATSSPQEGSENASTLPHPLLSTDLMILLQDEERGDEISLSFSAIERAEPRNCSDLEYFRTDVNSVMEARNCFSCHGGGASQLEGREPANRAFDMNVDDEMLCRGVLQRISRENLTNSPMFKLPIGRNGHPEIFTPFDAQVILPMWSAWTQREFEE